MSFGKSWFDMLWKAWGIDTLQRSSDDISISIESST